MMENEEQTNRASAPADSANPAGSSLPADFRSVRSEEQTPAEANKPSLLADRTHQAEPGGIEGEAFEEWLQAQPMEFHAIARRWGKEKYLTGFRGWQLGNCLAMIAGKAQEALQLLANESARTRKIAHALLPQIQQPHTIVMMLADQLVGEDIERKGISREELMEIQQDLQRAAVLAQGGRGQESGILIARH